MELLFLLGPPAPEDDCGPTPRYLLRRRHILSKLRSLKHCDLMEVGWGAGMLLQEFSTLGFHCQALEGSPQTRGLTGRLQARGIRKRLPAGEFNPGNETDSNCSNIERDHVMHWYPVMCSLSGQLALQRAFATQTVSSRLPFGNGYLIKARRR